jgi:hypothetical protein
MANVQEIIDFISTEALGANVADETDTAIFLKYINKVWGDIYRTLGATCPELFAVNVTGIATPSAPFTIDADKTPSEIVWVLDTTNGRYLTRKTYEELMDIYGVEMDAQDAPAYFYVTHDANNRVQINPYPLASVSLRVRTMPPIVTLNADTDLGVTRTPAEYHDALGWGALEYIFHSEDKFRDQFQLQRSRTRYLDLKTMVMSWATRNFGKTQRTQTANRPKDY